MPPTDLQEPRVSRAGLADERRARAGRRLRRVALVVAVLLVASGATAFVMLRRSDEGEQATPDTTPRTSTTTTAPTTTTSTTTTLPPTPTSVPGVTVGPLIGGPGPIPVIHRVPTTDPVVFITIDDGAYADPLALDVIRNKQVPVTLFLNQVYMKAHGDYFEQLQDAGAVIGSHTMDHSNLRGKDPATQHARICDLVPEFQGRFGAAPTLFRPPYGNYDPVTLQEAASCGVRTVVHWSATADGGAIVTAEGPLRAGDVILMHFKPDLGLKLEFVLAQIQAAGLRPARLVDYLESAPPAPPSPPPETTVPAPPAPATTIPPPPG
ncbi:polysaccharide deacetylase family protein [Dermatobacter hominis]|uniref:polysaccharide deacetylase family protein n=1 Tax=Dermatobacter hominis TaxID=2884263 RepID=UPI001D1188AC|nr:polysaccharide deacetylase family protein [Dermatobacter hominis]UDY36511.1 polysaccharide deacetylase family protein [Dermatobacter hominis]